MSLRRILVISKDAESHELARRFGKQIFAADSLDEALETVQSVKPELILLNHQFKNDSTKEFLVKYGKGKKNIPIVVVTDDKTSAKQVTQFKQAGALDCLSLKSDCQRLEQIVNQIQTNKSGNKSEQMGEIFFVDEHAERIAMAGQSQAVRNTLQMIKLVAKSRCNPVLVLGETGTGKEIIARAVHTLRHPDQPFVAVNCAALTSTLLESELFGHAKGSFTSADREKTGLFELAAKGSIFLDEISEMPMQLQAKLLRVFQEKTFMKVGGTETITCNATIITSSNRNLRAEVEAKRFRQDLYYRLNICPIMIEPLRASTRRMDIPILADYFLKNSSICPEKQGRIKAITKLAIEALEQHDWPGNVRELQNVIERAIILETTEKIGLSSIVLEPQEMQNRDDKTTSDKINEFSLAKAERELVAQALRKTRWHKSQAANLLGITRATLYAKLKQYNIEKVANTNKDFQDSTCENLAPAL